MFNRDTNLICEYYLKSLEDDSNKSFWDDDTLKLKQNISSLPKEKLEEYLKLIIKRLELIGKNFRKKYGRYDEDKFIQWTKPEHYLHYMSRRLEYYFKSTFDFDTNEISELIDSNIYNVDISDYDEWSDHIRELKNVCTLWMGDIIRYDYLRINKPN